MARNDATTLKMKDLLVKRRDALRKARGGRFEPAEADE